MPHPLVTGLRLAAALAAQSPGETAADTAALAEPTEGAYHAVSTLTAASAPHMAAKWEAQRAPGGEGAPAADARRVWTILDGWVKVPVGKNDGAAQPAAPQLLPDTWPRGRDYERAWYVLRADLGDKLPETLWLRFDAVAHQCEVFVNGRHAGHHIGGFTPFEFDITPAARAGLNTIAVFVRDETAVMSVETQTAVSQLGGAHPGEFSSPAGVRGGVFFEARRPVHVDHLLIRTSTRKNEIRVSTWLRSAVPADAIVTHAVYAWPGGARPVLEFPAARGRSASPAAEAVMPWADALRWSPEHPHLYTLRTTVRSGEKSETVETRFGFREFWTEGKNFVLNGTPVRLLGASLARDLHSAETPEVGRRYGHAALEFLKREFNYRALRFHARIHPPGAAEAADEVGVLVINQSSLWSAMGGYYTNGADELLKNTEREFAEWFWRDANHPSIVIWDVENEMIRDQRTPERERWVLQLDQFLKRHDPSLIVEHSGAAWYSQRQETIHLHMQEQYSEALRTWARDGRVPIVMGEFWVGGRGGETRLPNGYEFADRLDWHQEESRLYREKILEMRNYGASAVMPFWLDRVTLGRTNPGVRHSYDPRTDTIFRWPYPGLRNLGGEALAPVIAFAWPRSGSVVAGAALEKEIVVCNDLEESARFTITCEYAGQRQQWLVALAPAAQARRQVSFPAAATGDLVVTVVDSTGRQHIGDTLPVHAIAPASAAAPKLSRRLVVLPAPAPAAAEALRELGLSYAAVSSIPADAAGTLLLVPPGAPGGALGRDGAAVRKYLSAGGRLLAFAQTESPAWLPLGLPFWPSVKKSAPEFTMLGWPAYTRYLIFSRQIPLYAPGHPAFAGLTPRDFEWWSESDGRIGDDAFVRPNAVDIHAGAPYRVLAGSTRRENASLIECPAGAGTAIFCQAQVLNQRAHPAACALLMNLLRYLDGPAWRTSDQPVGFTGELTAARLAALSGLRPESFVRVTNSAGAPPIVLAGDGAAVALLDALARDGRTVLVLSRETAGRLPGYAVSGESNRVIGGTRARTADAPLFWGVASASFLPLGQSPAKAVLAKFPASAQIALGGLSSPVRMRRDNTPAAPGANAIETMEGDQPIAVIEARGRGRLAVTTIEPWNLGVESHRQLLSTLLANAGVSLPGEGHRPAVVPVKPTVPLHFDGRLDDWTNDMEDRNVSPFQHAAPIILGSRDAVSGPAASDIDLSGVFYLLHDARNLYLAGIVFSSAAPPQVELELDGRKLVLDLERSSLALDGAPLTPAQFATGRQPAREITDTRLLALTSFNPQIASLSTAIDTPGRTFEVAIPWAALGCEAPPTEWRGRFRLSQPGRGVLQQPNPDDDAGGAFLTLRIEK